MVLCLDHWLCTAELSPTDGPQAAPAIAVGLGTVERFSSAALAPGPYRLTQTAVEGVTARGVFEVTGEAPDPAPLAPTDTVAISVAPVLVPPEGATVTLSALVPAGPDGGLSLDDVIAATEGLAAEVTIEQWTDDRWQAVAHVPLTEHPSTDSAVDPDDPYAGETAEIPPLPTGAYRLVREGPTESHHGSFWVDAQATTGR